MNRSFNVHTVLTLTSNTSSVQLNHAIQFCKDWIEKQDHFVFHTSGSTGIPKRIELTRVQLEASAKGTIEALHINSSDHIFVCLNTQLIAGAMMLVRGMMASCEVYIEDPSSDPLQHISLDHPYTFASFVPMQLHGLLKNEQDIITKLNRFSNILVGGATIPPILEEGLAKLTGKVYHTYGMTETVSHIALKQLGKDTCFTTLPGVQIKTDDRDCLCIRSAATNNEWIVTNDLVQLLNEHQFALFGRADDVINSGGVKIFPAKVEAALYETVFKMRLEVKELFVTSQKDDMLGEKLVAVFCSELFTPQEEELLKNQLKTILTSYEIPKQYYYLPSFEKTGSEKIDKSATLKLLKNQ